MAGKAVLAYGPAPRGDWAWEGGYHAPGNVVPRFNMVVETSTSYHCAHRSLSPFVPKDKARQGKGLLHSGSGLRL